MSLNLNKNIGTITPLFTPNYFKTAYNNYKNGNLNQLLAMFEYAEIDTQVSGCMLGRDAGYKKEWKIQPASESKTDIAIADFFTEYFNEIQIRDLFEDVMDAKYKKYSVLQFPDWEITGKKQMPTSIEKVEQKYFKFDTNDGNKLKLNQGSKLEEIPEDAGFAIVYRKHPILLPVLRDYILKEFGVESWAAFLEAFGEPFILGKYPAGSGTDFITQVENAVNALGSSSRGTAPIGSELEIVETNRTAGDHKDFTDNCNRGIAIALLGHENAVKQSSGMQVGENSSAFKVKRDIAIDDIYFIENALNHLLKFLTVKNYSGVTVFPKFQVDKSEPINVKERLLILEQAYSQGLEIDPQEYALLGIKVPDNADPLIKINLLG